MADDRNGFIEALDAALQSSDTPTWIKPILLRMRDDHTDLREHLDWHDRLRGVAWKVGLPILGLVLWPVVQELLRWLPTVISP
jgi:hypothetical protein